MASKIKKRRRTTEELPLFSEAPADRRAMQGQLAPGHSNEISEPRQSVRPVDESVRECRLHASKAHASESEIRALVHEQQYRCATCGNELTPQQSDLDHKRPRSRGGTNTIENLQWLCRRCNMAKGKMTHEEFVRMCRDVAKTAGDCQTGSVSE